ncbi:MAG TPA: hypothetical protein VMY69_07820, partial [Phycisphaerae bacterium]|nr:hypothetical protein [Phycisphaerae bacterium]
MAEMASHERFKRMFEHREADRIPIIDSPWGATVERWQREGMPADVDWTDFFGVDRTAGIGADTSPRYPETVLEETDTYQITTTSWGATWKNWKHVASTPESIDFICKDPDTWFRETRARMAPTPDRINWDRLKTNYPRWRQEDLWIEAGLWFGFDVNHSRVVGTERFLIALLDHPEWCRDMFNHFLDVNLALLDMVWDAGYTFDAVGWSDDLGYKGTQFMSLAMYRDLLKPVQERACRWAHAKG